MDGISDKTLHSATFRYLIIYLAFMTTISFFLVGYNQSSVCSTQRDNVDRTIQVYNSVEETIKNKITLYESILKTSYPNQELEVQLKKLIRLSERELIEIKNDKPEKVSCFLF